MKTIPKKRSQHHSYDESVNESPPLLLEEAVEIETERPVEDAAPIEQFDPEDTSALLELAE